MDCVQMDAMVCSTEKFLADKDGTQVRFDGETYAVGDICVRHLLPWERPINMAPSNPKWRALYLAALTKQKDNTVSVVVGAPHSILSKFADIPQGELLVDLPNGNQRRIMVENAMAISECAGHALAYQEDLGIQCLVFSFGFGTVEMGAANSEGIIDRSLDSATYGAHVAADEFRRELVKIGVEYPDARPDQLHFWDRLMRAAYLKDEKVIHPRFDSENRPDPVRWPELEEPLMKVLNNYADNLVTRMQGYFRKFHAVMPVILTGGAINYSPVKDRVCTLLRGLGYNDITVATPEESLVSAARGYRLAAQMAFGARGVGIDIGNHNVVVAGRV